MDISVDLLEGKCKFYVHVEGEISGESYMGTFTCKGSLSPLDVIKSDKRYRELMGKDLHYATDHAAKMAFSLAQMSLRITEAPDWWKNPEIDGGHIDENVISEVFNKVIDCEIEFRKQRKEKSDAYKKIINEKITNGDISK